jgi:hypothetical protein
MEELNKYLKLASVGSAESVFRAVSHYIKDNGGLPKNISDSENNLLKIIFFTYNKMKNNNVCIPKPTKLPYPQKIGYCATENELSPELNHFNIFISKKYLKELYCL